MNLFTQFFKNRTPEDRKKQITQDLIRREVVLTQDIFGPVPKGTRREFFCLDRNTWVWYEEWTNKTSGQRREFTTRYVVRPKEILKSQNSGPYRKLTIEEMKNFKKAVLKYHERVKSGLYRVDAVEQPGK